MAVTGIAFITFFIYMHVLRLGRDAALMGEWFPTFWRDILPSSSWLKRSSWTSWPPTMQTVHTVHMWQCITSSQIRILYRLFFTLGNTVHCMTSYHHTPPALQAFKHSYMIICTSSCACLWWNLTLHPSLSIFKAQSKKIVDIINVRTLIARILQTT
jgi:hypothetical protein